ncbi:MAG TPA: hypothetical protein DCS93_09335 [Microscillaceae bacterium]|nr:hypothetical protein [Microscillaceae bacterium]
MANQDIFFAKGDSPEMLEAFQKAQETFKYYWREISWEYRRVVPALEVACVKVAFAQQIDPNEDPLIEHMWVNNVDFDGDEISGVLVNEPQQLTNVQLNDEVTIPLEQISDWLFAISGKTYGGFTIHAMRTLMSEEERKSHDEAWGLDFGDVQDILCVYEQKEHPENLIEHPMSRNMKERWAEFVQNDAEGIANQDEQGYNLLHREVIAGNATSVAVLVESGYFDLQAKTNQGKTALDFAQQLDWAHIIPLLERN